MPKQQSSRTGLSAIGPAIIVASVVLGPGSILTNSKVGFQFGYDFIWVLALACLLMWGMTTLAGRLGVVLEHSPCEELARRWGRIPAIFVGGSLFLVAASFQFSNNLGVLFGLEPLLEATSLNTAFPQWPVVALLIVNGGIIALLLRSRELYRPVERAMKLLVMVMIIGFGVNLFAARPSLTETAAGLVPSTGDVKLSMEELLPILGMIATTFSVVAAFYQAYLVKQKGWTVDDAKQGAIDSAIGITMLGLMSLMVMVTAASVLHDNPQVEQMATAADVAMQLQPLFGSIAVGLFAMGILAGALSSFLVNAMIGGTVLADAIGKGSDIDQPWPRYATVAALLFGMVIAIAVRQTGLEVGNLIVFAQAITVLGNPILALTLLWLAYRPELVEKKAVPKKSLVLGWLGFAVVLILSARTAYQIYGKLFE